jgi:uncharacterized surface protein with fasciclin (FAS1) repeats
MIFSQIKKITLSLVTVLALTISFVTTSSYAATGDIVDVASKAPQFSTLVKAVTAADLVATLQGPGPFTVLAPTDAAFSLVPAETLKLLLLPENKPTLVKLLTYHVISGKVLAADIVKLTTAKSVEGSDIKIAVEGTTVKLNGPATSAATVTATDIAATNGVIHSIDAVLIPPTINLSTLKGNATPPATTTTPAKATVRTGAPTQVIVSIGILSIIALALVTKMRYSK